MTRDTEVLTLNDANLGCIRAYPNRETLTLRLVGEQHHYNAARISSQTHWTMNSLSIEGDGRLHVKAQQYAANFYVGISYQQSGGEVTLEGFGVLNGSSGSVKLTGGKLTLARRDAADGQASGCARMARSWRCSMKTGKTSGRGRCRRTAQTGRVCFLLRQR